MDKIKFGTDGWRAIIARDYTISNVVKISLATALWLTRKYKNPTAVIGYDCRFGGEMFMEATAKVLASKGIRVFVAERFVTTPMVSLGVVKLKAECGIIITASHNGAEYNGYKLRGDHGGPMFDKDLKDVENLISNDIEIDLELLNWNYLVEQGLINYIDLESIYLKDIRESFNLGNLSNSGMKFGFDAMYGSSQNIITKLMPGIFTMHCEVNPSFHGIKPEPLRKNLHELAEVVWNRKNIDCSLAVDGDGDRIAMLDKEAGFYDANHLLLLLIHYLAGYKKLTGKVVVSFSTTGKTEKICSHYNLEVVRTHVGFKDASKIMTEEQVLIAGEESGGISIGNTIPERDAIRAGLTIWQWLIESGKPLKELYNEVVQITGPFSFERANLDLNRNARNKVLDKCNNGEFDHFGRFIVDRFEVFDGFKFFFSDKEWLMIRSSGTEPVIRLYAEAETEAIAQEIIFSGIKAVVD
jgi:phosphomannomutase